MKILYLITLFFQEVTSLNSYREYIACVYNHKELNSTFHRHFSFCRYILLSFLYRHQISSMQEHYYPPVLKINFKRVQAHEKV